MKNRITLLFSLLFMGILLTDCKKTDNEDPDGGKGGANGTGLSIDGKNVELKSAYYTMDGPYNDLYSHVFTFYSFDASSAGFSKSANFMEVGTTFSLSIESDSEDLDDGEYRMNETDEMAPYVTFGSFLPGLDPFENSNVMGEIYYAIEIQITIESAGDSKTITTSGKLIPISDFFGTDLSNALPFSLQYKGTLLRYNY